MFNKNEFDAALKMIFDGIDCLQKLYGNKRPFTIDGRLVGDLGEVIAEQEFEIVLDGKMRAGHDAVTRDGRDVQIKATFKDSLTFRTEPILYLGLKLFRDGRHEIIYNGPGHVLTKAFGHRKGFGKELISLPIKRLRDLSAEVNDADRVPPRTIKVYPP
jgi:hypothetical protein